MYSLRDKRQLVGVVMKVLKVLEAFWRNCLQNSLRKLCKVCHQGRLSKSWLCCSYHGQSHLITTTFFFFPSQRSFARNLEDLSILFLLCSWIIQMPDFRSLFRMTFCYCWAFLGRLFAFYSLYPLMDILTFSYLLTVFVWLWPCWRFSGFTACF